MGGGLLRLRGVVKLGRETRQSSTEKKLIFIYSEVAIGCLISHVGDGDVGADG